MGDAKYIGRVGALAAALGVGHVRRAATRMTLSIGAAAMVVMATVAPVASASSSEGSPPDKTALIMCGTTCPTPDEFWVESIKNQFVAPTHPGQDIDYVGVTAPMEFWPITGIFRLVLLAVGPPELWGPDGPGWPDEPWWKLSGLFDLTADQSLQAGVADLEAAMANNGNDHLVVYGNSQGAGIANVVKKRLAEQYPEGTEAPDIDFVLGGDPNLPNGGLVARFPGLYIPIVDLTFNGPAATDTQFKTVEINRQYDGFSDFPLYPLNVVADLNAVLGVFYVHAYGLDVSMAPDAPTSPTDQGTHGDTSYYFFETPNLPLFGPLRSLGVPERVIDVVEPFVKVIVDLGYDRSIPPWEPTPARLIPPLDPAKVATDLVNAIGEGVNNALALVGVPPLLSSPAPTKVAAAAAETATADTSFQTMSTDTPTQTEQVNSTRTAIDTHQMSRDTSTSTTATETASAEACPQGAPAEPVTETDPPTATDTDTDEPTSPTNATETTGATSTAGSAAQPTPKTKKPADHRVKPRRPARDSLGLGQQLPERSNPGEGDPPTTRTAAAGTGATIGGRSSAAASSTGSSAPGDLGADGDDSSLGSKHTVPQRDDDD